MDQKQSFTGAKAGERSSLTSPFAKPGDPCLLYGYYIERAGCREFRTINEYHMNMSYGGQSVLEAFLRARCTKVEFLGTIRGVEEGSGIRFLDDEPGAVEFLRKVDLLRLTGACGSAFFEEGTNWLDELRIMNESVAART